MPDETKDGKDAREYRIEAEKVWKELDPDLQRVVLDRQARPADQLSKDSTKSAEVKDSTSYAEAVDVIAKLRDPKTKVEGLNVVEEIGQIVTGMVDADKIEDVRRHPNVISLKAARRLRPTLANSVPEIRASREQFKEAFPCDPKPLDGSNVIVGIIDHGCDFAHPNFRKPDPQTPGGATRVLYLWDQHPAPLNPPRPCRASPPKPYGYGREFDSVALNNALREATPAPQAPTAPHKYLCYEVSDSHGTAVMDIAAGNGVRGENAPGVAPGADIIFVDQFMEDYYMTGESFGNSRRLLEAVAYVFRKADQLRRPAVVNISMNYDSGPHDGSTLVEQGFDRLLETPGRAIVVAAGNSRVRDIHVRRALHPRRTHTLRWELGEDERNRNRMEVWYSGARALSLILRSPRGYELGPFPLDSTYTIYRNGERAGYVFHRANDPNNGDNNLVLAFTQLMEAGVWELDLLLLDDGSHLPIEVHAWAETDEQPSGFLDLLPTDTLCTLGVLGCGDSTIVVGGYDPLSPVKKKMEVSGEGPTRDGKLKPEVSAPGTNIIAALAGATSTNQFTGTSAAAPHVTGLIALLMQSAGAPLFIEQIREFVINTARDCPPSPEHGWDTCYGAGRVDAVGAVQAQRSAKPLSYAAPEGPSLAAAGDGSASAEPGAEIANDPLAGTKPGAVATEVSVTSGGDAQTAFQGQAQS